MADLTSEEMEKALKLSYPPKDDKKGSARVNWKRRWYYFGKHNTPESFQLFVEWRRRLIETGEPPETKLLRKDLAHIRQADEAPPSPPYFIYGLAAATLLFAISTIGLTWNSLKPHSPHVDGVPMSQTEMEFVRGLRVGKKRHNRKLNEGMNSHAQLTLSILGDAKDGRAVLKKPPIDF